MEGEGIELLSTYAPWGGGLHASRDINRTHAAEFSTSISFDGDLALPAPRVVLVLCSSHCRRG